MKKKIIRENDSQIKRHFKKLQRAECVVSISSNIKLHKQMLISKINFAIHLIISVHLTAS